MNSYGYQPYNFYQPTTVVEGFRLMPRDMLAQLREELGLKIGIGELIFCQNQYKKENRDPDRSELLLLDLLIAGCEKKPSAFLLSEAHPAGEQISRTLADLQRKLEALNKKQPYSFADIASAAELYLSEAGKKTATPGIYGKCADLGPVEFAAKGAKPLATVGFDGIGSKCTLGVPNAPVYSKAPAKDTDSFIAVCPGPYSSYGFEDALLALLSAPDVNPLIKRADTAENGGALRFMLDSANGFYADLSMFPGFYQNPNLTLLADTDTFAVLLLADAQAIPLIQSRAAQLGLVAGPFARPVSAPTVTVRGPSQIPITMNADFLRSIKFTAPIKAVFAEDTPAADIRTDSLVGCADEILYSAIASSDVSFESAAEALVAAVSSLVARGVDFESISISIDTKLPLLSFDPTLAGKALSMLLGIYRTEAELSLRAEGNRHTCSDGDLSLCAYARAKAPQNTVSDKAVSKEGKLYIVSPRRGKNGFFDFETLRKLFKFITALVKEGKALAVCAVGIDGVDAAIRNMTDGAELSGYLIPEEISAHPIGSFIVESAEVINGLCVDYKKIEDISL